MKKQADIAKGAADSHQAQAEKSEDEIRSFDNALNEQMKRRREVSWGFPKGFCGVTRAC